ncbi:MAG TPA: family 20 glycosylhydrolase [Acidobacteriaceae bacterium]|nr:family 20 glycosylhydrolase [Acidobacteriaceae bacterium]
MKKRTRREFLAEAGAVLGGSVVAPRVWGAAREMLPGSGASAAPIRGLMVDAGRVPEKMEYYRRVVEFCAEWEMNALHFRLADDQGSALKFATVPGLVAHRNAFTPEEMHGLAEYGRSQGVDVIPELESFGHTGYITRSAKYAHLADESPEGTAEFTGVIPVSAETLELFAKLYAEVEGIFSSPYLHTGCDEVNWGGSAESRAALKTKTRAQIWAEYLNKLNALVERDGKQMIVWGDFVLHKEPEILPQLKKNIVIMDWQYSVNSSEKVAEALERVKANGSRGIGAPALICYKWGPRAGREQLRNIDAFAEAYLGEDADAGPGSSVSGSLGMVLTNWVPSRYVQRSIWDGFAYAAVAMRQGTAVAQTSGLRRFVERHYGARWSDEWDEAMALVYDDAPSIEDRETRDWMGMRLVVPWSTDAELTAAAKGGVGRNPYIRLRTQLEELAPTVQKNADDFAAFALSVEAMGMAVARVNAVAGAAQIGGMDEAAAAGLIAQIAQRDAGMVKKLTADWDEGRPADAAAKTELLAELHPKDELLYAWGKAAAYSAELANDPRKFYGIVTGVR